MMRAFGWSVLWLLGGTALIAGLSWAFLNTPESTMLALLLSALQAIAVYAVRGTTICGALVGWKSNWRRFPLRPALAGVLHTIPLALMLATVWFVVGAGLSWLSVHSGEISARFIATFDWSDVRPLYNGIAWAGSWVMTVGAPYLALVSLAEALSRGWNEALSRPTLKRALSPIRLALVTAIFAATLWVPISYGLYWMPSGLPPTWVEPAVAIAKFTAMATVAAIGLSLIMRLASGSPSTSSPS